MKISTPSFDYGEKIPDTYTCDGEGINPPLLFLEVPEQAQSLVLIVDDPDAPRGTFTHWVVFNIDPKVEEVPEGLVPKGGVLGKNSAGESSWIGPCPPTGEHRYFFKLYALDTELDLSIGATKEEVEKAMQGHVLDTAELIGLYSRM